MYLLRCKPGKLYLWIQLRANICFLLKRKVKDILHIYSLKTYMTLSTIYQVYITIYVIMIILVISAN